MKRNDFIIIILLMIILLGGFFIIMYYFNNIRNECLANPLVYGAKQMEKQYGYPFSAFGYFKDLPNNVKIPKIFFNSTDVRVDN